MIGQNVSHYKITRQIGSGGMGEVYLALDTKLGRNVALKILPSEVASDADRMRRFEHEAKAASLLNHPNVSHIYEIGEADGIHFIAMEYIEGQTLNARIHAQPLETTDILNIAIQVTDALDEAHDKGIIHRDLKAANIMITLRDQVKVLDFGLAKMTKPMGTGSELSTSPQTEAGVVMGTVHYMSPEQALGKKVDHRSDIFSLGVVVYQMATGRLPFSGETQTEILSRIMTQQPEAIARLNYNVPPDMERIIRKCLEKDPERRYQSAHDVLIDLKNLKRDMESTGTAAAPMHAATSWRRYFLLLFVAGVLAGGGYALYRYANRGPTIHSIAVLPFINVNSDPSMDYLSDGITTTTIDSLSQLRDLRVMARTTVFTYKGKQVDPRKVGQDLKVDAVVTGSILQQGHSLTIRAELVDTSDGSQIWGEQYSRSIGDIISMQSDLSREISETLRLKVSGAEQQSVTKQYTKNPEAFQLYLKGTYFQAKVTEEGENKAIDYFQQAIEKDPNFALAYSQLSFSHAMLVLNGWSRPKDVIPEVKSAALTALELDKTLGQPHFLIGWAALFYDWNWSLGEKEMKQGYDLHPNDPGNNILYALSLSAMGRHNEAIAEAKRAVELDPLALIHVSQVAWLSYNARRYDEAIKECNRAIEMDPNFDAAYAWRGGAYWAKGEPAQAVADYEMAIKLYGKDSWFLSGLASANAALGRTETAQQLVQELLDQERKRYVPPFNIAAALLALGEKNKAFQWLEKGYAEHDINLVLLKVDAWFDPIRSDPRFANLLRRMNLPN